MRYVRDGLLLTLAVCIGVYGAAVLVAPLLVPLAVGATVISIGLVVVRGRWD